MILVAQMAPNLTLLTLLAYVTMTSAAFLTLIAVKSTMTLTLASAWTKAPALAALASLILLSLGGLPPLTGFIPKWLILQELASQGFPIVATIIALAALLSLYFYLRLTYTMALTLSSHTAVATTSWRPPAKLNGLPTAAVVVAATCLLPLTPTILALTT